MASFKNLISNTSAQISSGGTITGDLVINGDLQVDGGGSLSFDEIIEGTQVIDVTNTEALLVRKDGDGGDVFIVDTTNSRVGVGITPTVDLDISSPSGNVQARLFRNANVKTSLTFKNSLQEWEIGNSVGDNNKFTIRDITDSRNAFVIDGSGDVSMTGAVLHSSTSSFVGNVGIGSIAGSAGGKLLFVDAGDGVADNSDVARFRNQEATDGRNYGVSIIAGSNSTDNSLNVMDKNSSTNFIVKGDGSCGIGTESPNTLLTVSSGTSGDVVPILSLQGHRTSNNPYAKLSFWHGTDEDTAFIMAHRANSNDSSADITFNTANNGTNAEVMRVTYDNKVGIGISDPDAYLAGANNLVLGGTSGDHGLTIRSASDSKGIIAFGDGDASSDAGYRGQIQYLHSSDKMLFITSTANRMILDANSRISLSNNDGGSNNTTFGYQSGLNLTTNGDENTLVGHASGVELTTGEHNVAVGHKSIFDFKEGSYNTAVGSFALGGSHGSTADASAENVAIGYSTMGNNFNNSATTDQCVAIGAFAMNGALNNADGNVAIGYKSLLGATSGQKNTAIGYKSGENLTSGGNSVMIGNEAGNGVSTSYYHVLIGDHAGHKTLADHGTTAVGYYALANATSGGYNTAIGYQSLEDNVSGEFNTAVGYQTLKDATGQRNSVLGYQALFSTTVAGNSVAVGRQAGYSVTDHGNNVFIGDTAGYHQTGESNIFIGKDAGLGSSGSDNDGTVAVGYHSLTALTSAQRMTAVGYQALAAEDAGSYQTAVGYQALSQVNNDNGHNTALGQRAGYNLTTGNANTLIGSGADASGSGGVNQTVIGASATGQADNSVTLGNADVTAVYMAQDSGAKVHMGDFHLQNPTSFTFNNNASNELCSFEARYADSPTGTTGAHIAFRKSADDFTSGTETARIADIGTSGNINANHSSSLEFHVLSAHTMTKTLTVGSNDGTDRVQLHKGRLQFPATQNADADANTLDDYEEGTYTPVVSNGSTAYSASVENGYYTKIGDQVFVQVFITSSEAGSGSAALHVTLPFSYNGAGNKRITASVRTENVDVDSSCVQLMLANASSGTSDKLFFTQMRDNAGQLSLPASSYSSGDTIQFNVHYKVA
jgi:hypothetical protein